MTDPPLSHQKPSLVPRFFLPEFFLLPMICLLPVSYTHLDVYKRQSLSDGATTVKDNSASDETIKMFATPVVSDETKLTDCLLYTSFSFLSYNKAKKYSEKIRSDT